jgi:hypothetical protein
MLITVKLVCKSAEVLNPLHPELIRNLPVPCNTVSTGPVSSYSIVTVSEYEAEYIH